MRINLNVPYAEKHIAKKYGALWDPVKKVWYIIDKENLGPFMKYMDKKYTKSHTLTPYDTTRIKKNKTSNKTDHIKPNK